MSTIKSSDEHLTLNADGSSKDIKFQANGVEKASISSAGAFTSTTIDATKLTGNLPAISGASLTGISSGPFTEVNANKFTYTTATNPLIQVIDSTNTVKAQMQSGDSSAVFGSASDHPINFIAGASETTVGVVDATGAWTMPLQPAFQVHMGSSQTNLAINTWTQLPYNTEIFDQNSDFNTTTYIFTAPVTGKYQFSLNVRYQDVQDCLYLFTSIVTSNHTYYHICDPGAWDATMDYYTTTITILADMDANDTAKVETYQAGGSATRDIDNGSTSAWSGVLIC